MYDENEDRVRIGISAAAYAKEVGLDRSQINRWVTRGYLNADGERIHVVPVGERKAGKRTYRVYDRGDLAAAELATRHRAPTLRGEPSIAAHQLMKRPHLASQLKRASAA